MGSKLGLAVAAGAWLLFAACSPAATTTAPAGTTPGAATASPTQASTASSSVSANACAEGATGTQTVTIADLAFAPTDLTVSAGTAVTWTNNDSTTHTATADDGSFDCGLINPGKSFTFTFATAGTFSYHCKIHPSMVAKITVS